MMHDRFGLQSRVEVSISSFCATNASGMFTMEKIHLSRSTDTHVSG